MNFLSILAIMKNEAMNLKIWIDHYISQGVDHFYLIDNGSDDESINIINDLIKNNYPITLHILLEKHVQVKHYRYVYDKENLKKATKWLIVADLDEFFYCKNSKISNELQNYEDYDFITSKWRMFGSNNCIQHPKDIRISLTKRVKKLNINTKYIFQTKNINSSSVDIHWLNDGYTNNIELSDVFRLNHYPIQSEEFFKKIKMTRGAADQEINVRDWDYFNTYNIDTDYNDEDLKNMILNKDIITNSNTNTNLNAKYYYFLIIIIICYSIYYLINNKFIIVF